MSRKPKKPRARRKSPAGNSSPADARGLPKLERQAVIGICAFVFVAVLLVFGRSAWFDFVDFDDIGNVSENPFVNKGLTTEGILWAFSHAQVGDWIPLTTISHMFDCQVFGLWAGGHHLTNVLLHAATSILLFLLLRDMTGAFWRCAFVAAAFALHPLRAESVAWISERKDGLSGFFFVLTLGAYVRWTRQPQRSRLWVVLFMALGLLCKTMLVTLPLVLLVLDYWPLNRSTGIRFRSLVIEKAPLFLLSIAAAVGQLLAARGGIGSLASYPVARRAANAVVSCAAYIAQMVWPAGLAGFYPYPRHGIDWLTLVASLALLVAVSAAAIRWRRRAPWIAAGWLWYLVMLLPVSGLVQTGEVARADRYTYLPQIGLYLIIAWTVGSWCAGRRERRAIAASLAAVGLVAFSLLAFRQTGFWKDSGTLWNRALACTSDNDTAHYNLATGLLKKGDLDEAMVHYQATLEANPEYADAHINLGKVLLQKGKLDEAVAHYQKALDIKPRYAEAHYDIGVVLAQQGRMDEAISRYRKAIEINPDYFDAQNNLGSALFLAGHPDEAIARYEKALSLDPASARAHNNLAAALVQKGRIADAIAHYQKVLEIDPGHAKACNSLAWLLATNSEAKIRDGAKAAELAERADRLTGGDNPLMLRTLAAAHAASDRFDDAQQTAQRALELAAAQGNEQLARVLRSDIELYKARRPLR